ncbi:MAG: serine hydrolase [Phycisphaeraceae bacterium]|nr:serine hydrolase [Phycisphaeraceae bacterium]
MRTLLALVLALLASPTLAQADPPDTPAGRALTWCVHRLTGDDHSEDAQRLHPEFLAALPSATIDQLGDAMNKEFDAADGFDITTVDARSERRLVAVLRSRPGGRHARITIVVEDGGDRIAGLNVAPAPDLDEGAPKSLDQLLAKVDELPGRSSGGIYEVKNGELEAIAELNADDHLATGSTFKLYVLIALANEILEGRASWDEPLAIREALKTLPGGTMQNLPAGEEHPIEHFALKMISISDNTATDHLISRVGRERVEAAMAPLHDHPALNRPFLMTREMFHIKLAADRTLLERFLAADETGRRALLPEIDAAQPEMALLMAWKKPFEIERVEWFASARECCRAMAELNRLARDPALAPLRTVLGTNPGVPIDRTRFPGVQFKGGSEPGVINLTWLLQRDDGRTFCVSLGWNDPDHAVDEAGFISLGQQAIALVGAWQP